MFRRRAILASKAKLAAVLTYGLDIRGVVVNTTPPLCEN
jgi:hypothetical protein